MGDGRKGERNGVYELQSRGEQNKLHNQEVKKYRNKTMTQIL